jgi:hypothetical protein
MEAQVEYNARKTNIREMGISSRKKERVFENGYILW